MNPEFNTALGVDRVSEASSATKGLWSQFLGRMARSGNRADAVFPKRAGVARARAFPLFAMERLPCPA